MILISSLCNKMKCSTQPSDYPAYILLYNRGTLANIVGLRAAMSSINFKLSWKKMKKTKTECIRLYVYLPVYAYLYVYMCVYEFLKHHAVK